MIDGESGNINVQHLVCTWAVFSCETLFSFNTWKNYQGDLIEVPLKTE